MRPVQRKVLPRTFSEESHTSSIKAEKIVIGKSDAIDDSNSQNHGSDPTARWEGHRLRDSEEIIYTSPSQSLPHAPILRGDTNHTSASSSTKKRSLSFMNRSDPIIPISSGKQIANILQAQDVFDVEEQTRLLSDDLEKTKLARSGNNAYNRKKSFLHRALSCSCFSSPRTLSTEELLSAAKTGDLFFDRRGTSFEGQRLPLDVIRGIRSTVDGKYMPKARVLQLWTRVSFVVCLSDTDVGVTVKTRRRLSWAGRPAECSGTAKYILSADNRGLRIRLLRDAFSAEELSACLSYMDDNRYICALRPLTVKSAGVNAYCNYADGLEEVVAMCLSRGGYIPWRALTAAVHVHTQRSPSPSELPMRPDPSSHEKLSGGDLDCSTTTDDGMVAGEISPWLRAFAERYFLRLHGVAFMPSAENLAEATRCFHLIAANYQMQASAKQSAVSTSEGWTDAVNSSSKTAGTVHAHVPLDFLRGHLSMMMQKGLHSGGQGGNQHFDDRLDRMLRQMDGDGDGSITLVEFLDAFVLLPCDQVPLEFDFQAIASAELVACILCELGLLPESALQSSVFFHPQSFSASATHSLLSHAFSADAKNRLRLNNIKQCAVVTSDMIDCAGIKFGADALLKAKLS